MFDFLTPIYKELLELELGFLINEKIYKFYILFGVFDKPARASTLNIINSNGYYGCLKCQQPGEFVPFGHGSHHIFRFDSIHVDGPLRNKDNYTEDLEQMKNGIKGKCLFNDLSYFNPVCSTNIDIMHS